MRKLGASFLFACVLLPAIAYSQLTVVTDYSDIYQTAKPALVTITTDDGSGSGFLVSPLGHIATNFHVIRNTRYLAVEFADGRRFTAAVAAVNPAFDVAVLKVNSAVVQGIQPLRLLPQDKEDTVKTGIPVVALGSPNSQKFLMTQGILSKVDELTLLGDFVLQAGNSGGPLLNMDSDVIGVNTFGEANLAGAIRVAVLREFSQSPLMLESMELEPSPELLPSIQDERYPAHILNHKVQNERLDWDAYRVKAGNFVMTAVTPVLIGKVHVSQDRMRADNRFERRSKSIDDPAYHGFEEPFYEWHQATERALDYIVTFDIRPASGLTKRSRLSTILAPLFTLGQTGKLDVEFKGEFMDFRIFRDGQLIEPIIPGRHVIQGSTEKKNNRFVDQAYSGSYVYSPDEFMAGNEFRMEIIDARRPHEIHRELVFTAESKLIQQIRSDFTLTADFMTTAP